ncbi:bifunctional WD40 repeat/WD40-repeat-containing domain superfamily/WD40-YVTN repeat-like-containing domain superfamily [Babesia duncani]|uniref:Bifunctional WD40 repeat/WD40-repeat-containing domain superfamily/WD40-YVTN repeat-like-containing domain superfamily n=1 Tax=Babesia duncani TaxID=323732 RepID=A0AAD9UQP8_9APIC|nr:bifunctional WD40 repeat/WD40-repeat-containing domain superfamily/WD40-YVTN repeat-like-containing domain superfamily [Babesia duncani]
MGSQIDDALDFIYSGDEVVIDEGVGVTLSKGHAISCTFSGSRIVTGSIDGTLTCIDFFKWKNNGFGPSWTANLDQTITSVAINHDETVVAACSGNRISFYTDGGTFLVSTTKGDMYLVDSKKTRGHVANVTGVVSDPRNFNLFASCSIDGTVRIFDVEAPKEGVALSVGSKSIFLPRASRGAKSPMHSLCYINAFGKSQIAAGSAHGQLIVWDTRTAAISQSNQSAHLSSISCLVPLDDGRLVSRSDDCIKLWDLKNLKKPLHETMVPGGDVAQTMTLSPDSQYIAACRLCPINPRNLKMGFKGGIDILKNSDLTTVFEHKLAFPPGPLVWANGTEQLFIFGLDGKVHAKCKSDSEGAMFISRAKSALAARQTAESIFDVSAKVVAYPIDHLPDNLEEADDGSLKRKRVTKQYKKPGAKPEPETDPVNEGKTPVVFKEQDIVAKLRSMAGDESAVTQAADTVGIKRIPYKADKFLKMYQQTQPDVILDFSVPETREENLLLGAEKCPRCGLKICQCGFMKAPRSA